MDVLTVSDFRLPGGTTHSNAEEIQAQHRFGLSTELVQLNGGLSAAARGLHPRIEGLIRSGQAHFAPTPNPRFGTVAIARHPAMISTCRDQLGPIEVEQLVVVVNSTPVDWTGKEHWRTQEVHEDAIRAFGVEPLWAPISHAVRAAIEEQVPPGRLRTTDWVEIIDVDHWWTDRSDRKRDRRPVVGRHSRPSAQKWPEQPERDLIYPPDDRWDIRVLGWDSAVQNVLGAPPPSWTVHRFGTLDPRDFLGELDFFVYFHHPNLVEAFGRTILEAIASGLPAILPPHFEPIFGASAIYATPETVAEVVEELWADEQAYNTHVTLAQALVRHQFSYEAHGARMGELLGLERLSEVAGPPEPPESPKIDGAVLIDLSSDAGLRQRALEDLGGLALVAALTLADAPVPDAAWTDLLPTAEQTSLPRTRWQRMAADRVAALMTSHPGSRVLLLTDGRPWSQLTASTQGANQVLARHTDESNPVDV